MTRPLHFLAALALFSPVITYCAVKSNEAANARRVFAVAYGTGSNCGAVIMSDVADSDTVAAALADASAIAKHDGCVTVWLDPDAPHHEHFSNNAGEA